MESVLKIIDLSLSESEILLSLEEACISKGFFYLKNHGIPQELISSAFEQSKLFFNLPACEKEKIDVKNSKIFRGYTDFNNETLDPKNQKAPDTKEGYYAGEHISESNPDFGKDTFQGPNQYPNSDLLPNFRKTIDLYYETLIKLGQKIARFLAIILKAPEDFFKDKFNNPVALIRLLHYNERKSDINNGVYACGAHSDYGLVTFLITDGVPGLELLINGQWIEVPQIENSFVVNLGDMLEIYSNGKFKSTKHRVVNKLGKERYSIPFFYEPNSYTIVEPLQCYMIENEKPKFKPVKYEDYIRNKYKESYVEEFNKD